MKTFFTRAALSAGLSLLVLNFPVLHAQQVDVKPATVLDIRTPAAPAAPRINGPSVFGVRPGHPVLYPVPVSGKRPISYSASALPAGISIDTSTGIITGTVSQPGRYPIVLMAKNDAGSASRGFTIVVGEEIALTPPMGWNSWNCFHGSIDETNILQTAQAMVDSGLSQHGWSYINIDDTWQGKRGGPLNAIQGDEKRFPDMKSLSDKIHALGLRFGLYSTPWVTSYAGHVGGSSENETGEWDRKAHPELTKGPKNQKVLPFAIGKYHFFTNDAKQWAEWGVDYLKFDWAPNEEPETKEMYDALRASGRDVVLSLSNNSTNSLFKVIDKLSPYANCWRIGGDINDSWGSIKGHGFGNDAWASESRSGHWNDPDMFEIGANGGGKPKKLTPDEQYTHVTQWALLAAPLLLGCDLTHLDPFTLGLLTNDEVLAVNQDSLGKQATEVSQSHGAPKADSDLKVFAKTLEDGNVAVGLFNTGDQPQNVTVKWSYLDLSGTHKVRDLWRQKDLGELADGYTVAIAPHGAEMIKVTK